MSDRFINFKKGKTDFVHPPETVFASGFKGRPPSLLPICKSAFCVCLYVYVSLFIGFNTNNKYLTDETYKFQKISTFNGEIFIASQILCNPKWKPCYSFSNRIITVKESGFYL